LTARLISLGWGGLILRSSDILDWKESTRKKEGRKSDFENLNPETKQKTQQTTNNINVFIGFIHQDIVNKAYKLRNRWKKQRKEIR
jgi:hypothetical protein